jgi:hypothetical protein
MSKKMKNKATNSKVVVADPAAAVVEVARALPAAEPVTTSARDAMRTLERRAPAALIALVVSMAEQSGGVVAGVHVDPTATRDAQAKAAHLRVGAAAARAVARYLEEQALLLVGGVAQTALSATVSLEALARTPSGRGLAAKAAELRAAARKGRRVAKPKAAGGTTTSPKGASDVAPKAAPATAAAAAAIVS